jgi:glycosyltransferase involved in cell wall biosynthesis
MSKEPLIVACVPAFNEEKTIGKVVLQAQRYVSRVIVCDDGSTDMTGEIATRLGADVIKHERNLGYGGAIQSLFRRARELSADISVTLDADGQHDPKEIPNVIKPVLDDVADIAIGSRFADRRLAYAIPWYRRAGIKLITKLVNNASKQDIQDTQSGFRAYSRRSLETLGAFENGMGVSVEVLISATKRGLRICEIPCSCNYGEDMRTSTQNPMKHGIGVVASILKIVIEDEPLTTLGLPGIMCLIIGSFFGVWVLQIYTVERQIVTNIALASIGFIMMGFFCLSTAITLYALSRINQNLKREK